MAYNKNLNIGPNNVVNISGSLITVTGSLTGSEFSGSRLQSTTVSASVVSASQYYGLNLTASVITGSELNIDYIDFVGQDPAPAYQSGRLYYNGSGSYFAGTEITDLNVNLGQQVVVRCINRSGDTLASGQVVRIISSSNSSDTPPITTASYSAESSSAQTLGLVIKNIADNTTGYVLLYGVLTNINTTAYTVGDMLYLSETGSFTKTSPSAPKHNVRIGQVVRSGNNGSIFVRVQNGYELDEIHDVLLTGEQGGDLLSYDGSTGLWKNSKVLTGSYQLNGNLNTVGSITASALNVTDNAVFFGNITVNGTASIAQLNTVSQSSLLIGDRYVTILSGGVDHAGINGAGFLWGTSSGPGETTGTLGEHAHILYDATFDALEIFPGLKVVGNTNLTGNLGISGSMVVASISGTQAQFTSLTGSLSGNATTATTATNITINSETATAGTRFLVFAANTTGNGSIRADADLTYNPGTNTLAVSNLTASTALSGTNIFSTRITGSFISGSQITGSQISGSHTGSISGTLGLFTTINANTVSASSYVGLTAGGTNTTVQFNSGSLFGGSSNFIWDNTNNALKITGQIVSIGSGNSFQFWKDSSATRAVNIGMIVPGGSLTDDLTFSTYDGAAWSEKMRIVNGGNVGIGKTPSAKLDINGNTIITGTLSVTSTIFGTASFASNADLLDNLNSTAFGQLTATNSWSGTNTFAGAITNFTGTTITGSATVRMTTISGTVGISGSNIIGNTITGSSISASTYIGLPSSTAAGSAGYIQFNTGSNVLGADSNFVWDNTNKRWSIGAASPQVRAEIVKGTQITSRSTANTVLMVSDNSTSQVYLEVANTPGGAAGLLFSKGSSTGNYGLINYSNTADRMDFYTAGTMWAHIGSTGKFTLLANSLEVSGSDIGEILNSYNTSASSAKQFYLKHNLGNVELGNARGDIYIPSGSVAIGNSALGVTNTLNSSKVAIVADGTTDNCLLLSASSAPSYFLRMSADQTDGGIGFDSSGFAMTISNNKASSLGYISLKSNSVNGLTVSSNGTAAKVGVNKTTANATLDVAGNAIVSGNLTVTGSITELSTRRIKTNVISLNDELTTISKLNPVSYTRIDDGRREYGFISEEVKEVYPEFVVGEGINYPKMVSILVSAVKELTQKVENQSREIELLKNKKKRTTRGNK